MSRAPSHDLFLRAQRDAFAWKVVGLIGLLIGVASISAWLMFLPLKEVRAVPLVIDPDTKLPKLLYERVEKLQGSEQLALREIVDYITDRETYDVQDNRERKNRALERSSQRARTGFLAIWGDPESEDHPDRFYGPNARVTIRIDAPTHIGESLVQAEVVKTLTVPNAPARRARYKVTLTYAFVPKDVASIDDLIANPLGFTVTDYRIDDIGEL